MENSLPGHGEAPAEALAADPIMAMDPNPWRRVIIDRKLASALGFSTPGAAIGETIDPASTRSSEVLSAAQARLDYPLVEIVGVVENDLTHITRDVGEGTLYELNVSRNFMTTTRGHPIARISAEDVDGGIAVIEQVWSEMVPHLPVNIRFVDAMFEASYRTYRRMTLMFTALSVAAVVISATGLFAMASHIMRGRIHEVGVRKTIGASKLRIVVLFLTRFSKPVLIGSLLVWPLAYLAAQAYLSTFVERIELTPSLFAMSLIATLGLAWAVVIGQTVKAATVRPAEVLRRA